MSIRKRNWLQVFGWVGLIYSTLGIVRSICEFLKKTTSFNFLMNALMLTAVLAIIVIFRKYFVIKKFSSFIFLVMWFGLLTFGVIKAEYPEERIHFLEYGLLGFLLVRALHVDWPDWRGWAGALVLGFCFGWIDEGIQEILPNRYYQWSDVCLNAAGTFLGVFLTFILNREHKIFRNFSSSL